MHTTASKLSGAQSATALPSDEALAADAQTAGNTHDQPTDRQDAGALLRELERAFPATAPAEPVVGSALASPRLSPAVRSWLVRGLKVAALLALVAFVGWQPMQRLLTISSVEAVVNARLVTIRSPIDGELKAGAMPTPGTEIGQPTELARVVNVRLDRTRLDELTQAIARTREERAALAFRLEAVKAEHAEAQEQVTRFLKARQRQLAARRSELAAELAAATATHEDLAAARRRAEQLLDKNAASQAQLDRARRDERVAAHAVAAARERLTALDVEVEANAAGQFMGDTYNDRPRSFERLEDARLKLAELTAEIAQRDARLVRLAESQDLEASRVRELSDAVVSLPGSMTVWEVLAAPGEPVNRGQDLVRLLDCSAPVVTAIVSEAVFNRLYVGAPARFQLKDTREVADGRVVQLAGQGDAAANLAISPAVLQKERFRVTVAVPSLAQTRARANTCPIGRTGRVTFGDDSGAHAAPGP